MAEQGRRPSVMFNFGEWEEPSVDEKETPRDDTRLNLHGESGMTRRDLMRRGAIVGGTLLWVAPAIQSVGSKAYAAVQGPSPGTCAACYCYTTNASNIIQRDECSDDGLADQRFSADVCQTFCESRGYADFQYCSGTTLCNCQQGAEGISPLVPPIGVTCT